MSWLNEIRNFLEDYSGVYPDNPNIDIWKDMHVTGDDFHEMIENYTKEYKIDMSSYLWYFHTDEEGHNFIGGLFFKPPYKRVKRIPITPKMLSDFVNLKEWNINYPDHKIPKKRYDLLINRLTILIIISIIILLGIYKLFII